METPSASLTMNLITASDPHFPDSLRTIRPPVEKLHYTGTWDPSLFDHTLAVVGSRQMTSYGERALEQLIPPLVNAGITIISGGMYGVDITAQRLCTKHGGKTIAVLGWGLDVNQDTDLDRLAPEILSTGGLIISEYENNRKSQLWMFPHRNRVVVGLSQAVLVIEAGEKSGSMVTAKLATKFHVPLFALPGPITSSVSAGTNGLIKSGKAQMVTEAGDILSMLGIPTQIRGTHTGEPLQKTTGNPIIDVLSREELTLDELAKILKQPTSTLAGELSLLELQGMIGQRNGKYHLTTTP